MAALGLKASEAMHEQLQGRLVKLRATGATLSKLPSDEAAELRKALRRSRRHKGATRPLSRDNARLRKSVLVSQRRKAAPETELAEVRASPAVLSEWLYGRRSEQQDKPRATRRRAQQPGVRGHGRTPRPELEERIEVHHPPAAARVFRWLATIAHKTQCAPSYALIDPLSRSNTPTIGPLK